jgi:hypothetical protein
MRSGIQDTGISFALFAPSRLNRVGGRDISSRVTKRNHEALPVQLVYHFNGLGLGTQTKNLGWVGELIPNT